MKASVVCMRKQQRSFSRKLLPVFFIVLALSITIFTMQHARRVQGATPSMSYTVYEDGLASGWKAQWWASRVNLANTSPVYSGDRSISLTPMGSGARLYLSTQTAVDTASYSFLHFAAQASQGGQDYTVLLYGATNNPLSAVRLAHYGGSPVPGTWNVYTIPLSDLGVNATSIMIMGVAIESRTRSKGIVYLDEIRFTGPASSSAAALTPTPTQAPQPMPTQVQTTGLWEPALQTSWQWQLTTPIDQSVDVQMYDIDGFDNDASVVTSLHAQGKKVVCYIDAGTFENWRSDANLFPSSVKGNAVQGWAGEQWLDIRNLQVLAPIMQARLDMCQTKGFDGVEFDNVDGYTNDTGFPLSANDQLAYNTWLAQEAHARGMSAGLKNDLDQVTQLLPSFDWALDEQCFQYQECDLLTPFIRAGKAVFEVEYSLNTSQFCPQADALNFNSLRKDLALDAARTACR